MGNSNNLLFAVEDLKSEFPHSYMTIPANKIFADPSYNRSIRRSHVEGILKNFNINLVNPLKVSRRDGKYWIFDGNHTLRALIEKNNGNDNILVDCKVHEGMTKRDEALMFALQFGDSRNVSSNDQLKALYVAENKTVQKFVNVIDSEHLSVRFTGSSVNGAITCPKVLYDVYMNNGEIFLRRILSVVYRAWGGNKDSLRQEMFKGMIVLYKEFYDEISDDKLIAGIRNYSPMEIIRDAKGNTAYKGNNKYAAYIGSIYNKGLANKYKLNLGILM